MAKDRFKLIVTYNGCRRLSLKLFQTHCSRKPGLQAFSRLFDVCSRVQGYTGAGEIMDFVCHGGFADDIIEIGLALGIPVKYVPEAKPKKERGHSEERPNRLVDVMRRAWRLSEPVQRVP